MNSIARCTLSRGFRITLGMLATAGAIIFGVAIPLLDQNLLPRGKQPFWILDFVLALIALVAFASVVIGGIRSGDNDRQSPPRAAPERNQISFELSDDLLHRVRLHTARRRIGGLLLLLLLTMGLWLLAAQITSGIRLVNVVIPSALLCVLVCVFLWTGVRKQDPLLQKVSDRTVTYVFTDESLESRGPLGNLRFEWRMFERLSRFADVWLLHVTTYNVIVLPTALLSHEMREFITGKIHENGGEVTGRLDK